MEVSPKGKKKERKKDIKRVELFNNTLLTLFNFHPLGFHQLYQVESASLTRIVLSWPILGEITGNV